MSTVELRPLGRNGLQVSPLVLGTMMFGGQTDDVTAQRIVDKAFEQGVNFIDTANVYEAGRSEEVVGRLIKARRGQWILSTKFGIPHPVPATRPPRPARTTAAAAGTT